MGRNGEIWKLLDEGVVQIHSVVGYVLRQPPGDSKLIMRRLTEVELVLLLQFKRDYDVGNRTIPCGQYGKHIRSDFSFLTPNLVYVFTSFTSFFFVCVVCMNKHFFHLRDDPHFMKHVEVPLRSFFYILRKTKDARKNTCFSPMDTYIDAILHNILQALNKLEIEYDSCEDEDVEFLRIGSDYLTKRIDKNTTGAQGYYCKFVEEFKEVNPNS
jgi:hypothetical protein